MLKYIEKYAHYQGTDLKKKSQQRNYKRESNTNLELKNKYLKF